MTTHLPPGYATLSATFSLNGSSRPQVFTMDVFPLSTLTDLQVLGYWQVALNGGSTRPAYATKFNASMVFQSIHLLRNNAGLLSSLTTLINAGGASGFAAPPPQTATIIQKKTALAGPAHRGRMYLPSAFQHESDIDDLGIISSSVVTAMQTVWDAFLVELNTNNVTPVILHRSTGTSDLITKLQVNPLVGTIRRRLRK